MMVHVDSHFAQNLDIFNFELEYKLYQLSEVEFDGEFNSCSFEAHKPWLNSIMDHVDSHFAQKVDIFNVSYTNFLR